MGPDLVLHHVNNFLFSSCLESSLVLRENIGILPLTQISLTLFIDIQFSWLCVCVSCNSYPIIYLIIP